MAGHTGGGHLVIVQPHTPMGLREQTGPAMVPSEHICDGTSGPVPHSAFVQSPGAGLHSQSWQPLTSVL